MLKPGDPTRMPNPEDERPIGDLVHDLIDDGKAYAQAEVGVVKATAMAKVDALKGPAILFGVAAALTLAAVIVLAVAGLLALAPLVGPILGGLIMFVIVAGIAGLLARLAVGKLKDMP